MSMYNLIAYDVAYLTTLVSLWQLHKDQPALDTNDNINDIIANNSNSASFNKQKITRQN